MKATEIAAIVSMFAFIVTAIFVLLQVRYMRLARNVEISMRLFEWLESERSRQALKWVSEKFTFTNYQDFLTWQKQELDEEDYVFVVISFFEQVGMLAQKKFVDFDVIVDHLGSRIITTWRKLEPLIMALRKEHQDEQIGEHFELLFEEANRYEQRRLNKN